MAGPRRHAQSERVPDQGRRALQHALEGDFCRRAVQAEGWGAADGRVAHVASHVHAFDPASAPPRAREVASAIAADFRRRKAIMGVFDEGCMGMYNAIIPGELLCPLGVFKERLSQSALCAASREIPESEARGVYDWLVAKGMTFHFGLRKGEILGTVENFVELLDIRTPSLAQEVRYLSGGNQHKVVVAKRLDRDCDILFFDEPTHGIDVGAKAEIHKLLRRLANQRKAIVMISSELPEILRMSDRIVVMCEGRITGSSPRARPPRSASCDRGSVAHHPQSHRARTLHFRPRQQRGGGASVRRQRRPVEIAG
jgi:hypothetical protein